jgi:hypothetical protein
LKPNKIFSSTLKNALACYNAGVVVENSGVEGLAPGTDVMILKIFFVEKFSEKIAFFDSKQS